MVYAKFLISS